MKTIFAAIIIFVSFGSVHAQGLGGKLSKVGSDYAKAYMTPAVNAFGVDLNSGLFQTAKVGGILPFGLEFYLGVKVGAAIIPNSAKSFNLSYMDTMYFPVQGGLPTVAVPVEYKTTNAPTIFGSKSPGYAVGTVDTTIGGVNYSRTDSVSTIGGLINTNIAALPVPQLGIGSLFGTDVIIRYLPKTKISSYGSVNLFGFAIKHNISQYIPLIPVDVAVQIGWQNLSIYDNTGSRVVKESAFAGNAEVSKTFAILTVYGGLQVESSTLDVNYLLQPSQVGQLLSQPVPISFKLTGKDTFRGLVGLNLSLFPFQINADYSVGYYNAISAGIGLSI